MNLDEPVSDIDVLVNSVKNAGENWEFDSHSWNWTFILFYFEFAVYSSDAHTIWTIFVKQVMKWQISNKYVRYTGVSYTIL